MELQRDYGLRRLFLLPLDYLPVAEQLQQYKQRDLIPSHIYRTGIKLFGNSTYKRTRIFESSQFSPPQWRPRAHHSCTPQQTDKEQEQKLKLEKVLQSPRKPSEFTEAEYHVWVTERMKMREDLEGMGVSERWLCSKDRTPAEQHLLSQLRKNARLRRLSRTDTKDTTETVAIQPTPEQIGLKRKKLIARLQQRLTKDAHRLEKFIALNRQRLADLLVFNDGAKERLVSPENLIEILQQLKSPVDSEDTRHLIILAHVKETKMKGHIKYEMFLKGAVSALIEKHITDKDLAACMAYARSFIDEPPTVVVEEPSTPTPEPKVSVAVSDGHGCRSTLGRKNGEWASEYQSQALKQFNDLMKFCQAHNITLNRDTAERALLVPADHSRKECKSSTRQPGLNPIRYADLVPPEPEPSGPSLAQIHSHYGWQYKEIRGGRKPTMMRLSTGVARVKAQTDSWMTYEEFMELTKDIQSRPGFKYKYHGLPPNNAFWAGALLDKLRLYLPQGATHTKPHSLYSIFQCVQNPIIYDHSSPAVNCRTSWPENDSKHVQLGPSLARTRTTYCL